ncbi:MAG: hypothetical protein AB7D47_11070 [Desulfovibrio sp.]
MSVGGEFLFLADTYRGSKLKPNISFEQQLEQTAMRLFTNDQGERVAKPGMKAEQKPYVLLGDSFAMGSGADYDVSFGGQLATRYGIPIANLGVGTYSLLQVVRHFEVMVPLYKPKVAVFVYNHGMVNRCFKTNAFMKGLGRRPVFVRRRKDQKIILHENRLPLPPWVIERIHRLRGILIGNPNFDFSYIANYAQLALLMKGIKKVRSLLHKLCDPRFKYIDDHEHYDNSLREYVLRTCLNQLADVAEKNGCTVLVYHMFEYRNYEKLRPAMAFDDQIIAELAEQRSGLEFYDDKAEKQRFEQYMAEHGLSGDYYEAFKLPDDIHHAPHGNDLLAESIQAALDEKGLLGHQRTGEPA